MDKPSFTETRNKDTLLLTLKQQEAPHSLAGDVLTVSRAGPVKGAQGQPRVRKEKAAGPRAQAEGSARSLRWKTLRMEEHVTRCSECALVRKTKIKITCAGTWGLSR